MLRSRHVFVVIVILQLGVHPVAVDLTLITDKEIGLYTKGTVQNKVHTVNKVPRMQIQTYTVTQGHMIHYPQTRSLHISSLISI
jgi:hypothetical protein